MPGVEVTTEWFEPGHSDAEAEAETDKVELDAIETVLVMLVEDAGEPDNEALLLLEARDIEVELLDNDDAPLTAPVGPEDVFEWLKVLVPVEAGDAALDEAGFDAGVRVEDDCREEEVVLDADTLPDENVELAVLDELPAVE